MTLSKAAQREREQNRRMQNAAPKKSDGGIFPCTAEELRRFPNAEAIIKHRKMMAAATATEAKALEGKTDKELWAMLPKKAPGNPWKMAAFTLAALLALLLGQYVSVRVEARKWKDNTASAMRIATSYRDDYFQYLSKYNLEHEHVRILKAKNDQAAKDLQVVAKMAMECAQDHPKWGRNEP